MPDTVSDTPAKIITIDGPSGVGKGTLSQLLADYYGFHVLDSGALYRVTAVNALRLGLNPENESEAVRAVEDLVVEFRQGRILLHDEDVSLTIREEDSGQAASKIAVHPQVREKLFNFMQAFVKSPGIVADGRDMGTVVFPQADLKIFLTAASEVRAKRRYKQLRDNGKDVTLDAVFSELAERDRRDSNRNVSPLEPAKDAVSIDTGALAVLQVFEEIKQLAEQNGILP